MKNIILFASGNGTNAENICRYFEHSSHVKVAALFCNKPDAKVVERMKPFHVPVHIFDKEQFTDEAYFMSILRQYDPSLIVLAGFLWLMPGYLIDHFSGMIVNIHPALLPKFGGKGMYGHHVHEAVLASAEKRHGITIHYVNKQFDEGKTIFQESFELENRDDLASISEKIAQLEMKHFPEVIEQLLNP
jgi:phosphoribosylglycinamide formyltransferase-1